MNDNVTGLCNCHVMEMLSQRAEFPVRRCDRTGTIELIHSNGLGRWRLTYCFECGGKLPEPDESWRSTPDGREQSEAESVMSRAKNVGDLIANLGPPDESMPWMDTPSGDVYEELADRFPDQYARGKKWVRCLRYSKRWPSLLLDVYEYEDGTIEHTIWEQNPQQE